MRRAPIALIALLAVATAGASAPAAAHAASSYCSPTGDQCYSAKKRNGVVRLSYATFSFSGKIRICVLPPGENPRTCKTFRLREDDGIYAVDVRWSKHFPVRGDGVYRVRYRMTDGQALGPAVTFRRR